MSHLRYKNLTFIFAGWLVVFFAVYLSLPHHYENRYLVSDAIACQEILWDTGYGFNESQKIKCQDIPQEQARPEVPREIFTPLTTLRHFNRLTLVKSIKILGAGEAKYWFANKHEKIELLAQENTQGEKVFSVENLKFSQTTRPLESYIWLIWGLLLLSVTFTWLSHETYLLLDYAFRQKSISLFVFVPLAWVITVVNIWACFPGLLNPFDPTGGMVGIAEYGFPGYLRTLYFVFLFGVLEVFGQVWSPIFLASAQALATVLFCVRYFVNRSVNSVVVTLFALVLLCSPVVLAYNVFLEKNITCSWMSVLLLMVAFIVIHERRDKLLWTIFILSFVCLLLQASTILFFPCLMIVCMWHWRSYLKPLGYLLFYFILVFIVRPAFLTNGTEESRIDYENYERISLLRYPTDLQYDCGFPEGVFSPEIVRLTNLEKVREGALTCQGRPIVHDSNSTTYSIGQIRKEILGVFLKYPEMVLASRVRLFFSIVGSDGRGFGEWDASLDAFKEFRQRTFDLRQMRDPGRAHWRNQWVAAIKHYTMYPYQSYYMGFIVVLVGLFLWSVYPAAFAVSLAYASKILITFLMAPTDNNFYLFDLYVVGFIIPLMMLTERALRLRKS